jgi:hypothetical protein
MYVEGNVVFLDKWTSEKGKFYNIDVKIPLVDMLIFEEKST